MPDGNSRIAEWLADEDGADTASVVSDFERRPESEVGDFDEARYRLVEEPVLPEIVDEDVAKIIDGALGSVAEAAQRKAVCGLHRQYVRGRMLDTPDYKKRQVLSQKFFRLEGFMELASLEDTSIVEALLRGPVRTRLGAETGIGKTMKLPGMLAAKCGLRVLQLELDQDVSDTALKYQKKHYKIPGGARSWSRQKKAYLTAMSYSEFRGVVLSGDRDRLFDDFDVFYMDEAHEPLAAVWVARQYFAAFAKPHNSLLVVSATMSTLESNNDVAHAVGKFDVAESPVTLDEAMASGMLLSDRHLRDRTQVLVACDEDAAVLRAYYEENGLDVYILDSASTIPDRENVVKMFSVTTAVVPRVVVATENYGTGYNIPLSYVISTCTRRVYELNEGNALVEREVPLMKRSVVQHRGRVGRGMATGAGGLLLSDITSVDKELLASEALEAYLSLIAASINPRPGLFNTVTRVLPKGVDAAVARLLLRSTLPVGLAVRYLGSDGRFASRFVDAVQLFHQTGEKLRRSKDEYPVGHESWVSESVGEYYEGDDTRTDVELVVPFKTPRGLKIQMHAISAVAAGLLTLEYWDNFDEEDESDDEVVGVRVKAKRVVVPRLPEGPPAKPVATVASRAPVWQYDADPASARVKRERRQGMSWHANGEGQAAVRTLVRALEDDALGRSVASPEVDVPEYPGKVVFALPLEEDTGTIPVKSAGGGRILLVTKPVYAGFMNGEALSPKDGVELMTNLVEIKALQRFAKSTIFDNWSPAWLCVFFMYAETGVFRGFRDKGLHSEALKLLDYLYDRFRSEVLSVAASSNLYQAKLRGFFSSRPSVSRFVSAAKKGKLPIAQSDTFVKRVIAIKDAYDNAVLAIESSGVFAPSLVTKAQKQLPIRDRMRNMKVVDEEVVDPVKGLRVDSRNGSVWTS